MARPPSDADYAEFVHGVWPRLYRTAYLLIGDHATAEDLVQTALASTYASWRNVRSLDAAHGYARTALMNTAASWFRKKGWRNEVPTDVLPESGAETDPTHRPAVLDALKLLPKGQRAVIVLRYYEDLAVSETARILDCSEGTVKSQTSAALSRLRVLLGDAVIPLTTGASHD
ncbi:SigE family RNA polymerase sigma factor [Nocardioides jensenii]|uniref:SigE family RNA polymerase sigma factor n=1 Tax=Nocardioides jensenii TaxID=1843 RepID=UPI000835551D|nr:SigE family RNA polymerase sigma factor [Nocardioides jensenii]